MNWNEETPGGDVLVVFVLILCLAIFITAVVLTVKGWNKLVEKDRERAVKRSVRDRFKDERWASEEARRILKQYEGK